MLRIIALSLMIGSAWLPGNAWAIGSAAGVITHFATTDPNAAHIENFNGTRPLGVLDIVYADETIVVGEGAQAVQFRYFDGEVITIEQRQFHVVREPIGRTNIISNFWISLLDTFSRDTEHAHPTLGSRDPFAALSFGLSSLEEGTARIVAGERSLHVRWRNGFGPYRAVLKDGQGNVMAMVETQEDFAQFPPIDFVYGETYTIELAEELGGNAIATFTATQDSISMPGEAMSGLGDISPALQALWLAREHPDEWSFEAQQILESTPDGAIDQDTVGSLIYYYGSQ